MAEKNGKTRPFNAVNYSAARLAREKQRREYEQQKKEKIIFTLFVGIILVMILLAILIFKNVLGGEAPITNDTETESIEAEAQGTEDFVPVSTSYEDKMIPKSDLYAGQLLLIDSSHPYREKTVNVTDIYSSRQKHEKADSVHGFIYSLYPADTTVLMEAEALKALNAMSDAFYKATGNYDLFVRPSAAYVEGASDEHATGRAVDLSGWAGGNEYYSLSDAAYSANFVWLTEHCYEYGFILRETDGACRLDHAFHFLYVGVPHAYYMYKNDLCLEEYLELLRTAHTFNGGESNLFITDENGVRYAVYYVAAEGDMVTVPVYINNETYSISGNNADGFLVTVTLK